MPCCETMGGRLRSRTTIPRGTPRRARPTATQLQSSARRRESSDCAFLTMSSLPGLNGDAWLHHARKCRVDCSLLQSRDKLHLPLASIGQLTYVLSQTVEPT